MSLAVRAYFRQIWLISPYSLAALLLPGVGTALTTYVPPLIVARMIRYFNGKIPSNLHEITGFLVAFAGVWLLGEIIWRFAFLAIDITDARAMNNLLNEAMEKLLKKDAKFFNDNFAGSLTKKLIGYGRNFEGFMDTLSFNIFGSILPLTFASVVLWRFSPWLDVALLGILVITFLLVLPLIKKRQKLTHQRETASNVMAAHVADVIGNVAAVRAFGHESNERKTHRTLVTDYTTKARKSWDYHVLKIDGVTAPLNILVNVIGLALAISLTNNAGTLATIFVTFNYFVQASRVVFEFNRTYRNIENSLSEAAQFTELIIEPPRIIDTPHAKKLNVSKGEVEFRNVDFTHAQNKEALFSNLSLKLESGEKVGIIGRSGAGKSTITNLLLRFMEVDGGAITIDGQDINEVTQQSLRQNIAYVPQESVLFHRSLSENITYGKLGSNEKDVVRAAKLAHAHEFISELPQGYDTLVGERGVKLSGGQRQRIAIARAILKNAPILVLDEATSALDSESEKLIQDALDKLMQGRTTIVIAHRLSTIQKMDRIIVLDEGKIVEVGNHSELLAKQGIYAKLWAHQSGGFLED